MHLQYMTLQSIHSDVFRSDNGIFREYMQSLKHFIVTWITSMNISLRVDKQCELSNVLCTLRARGGAIG
jgi:hypothetical protein